MMQRLMFFSGKLPCFHQTSCLIMASLSIRPYRNQGSSSSPFLGHTTLASAMVRGHLGHIYLVFFPEIETLPFLAKSMPPPCDQLAGFNCGEAVNFAIGDWFPLGEMASQRYALLNRVPLLPHEELLCKEAALLRNRCSDPQHRAISSEDMASQRIIKVLFARTMRFQHRARWTLTRSGARSYYSPNSQGTILCGICKRDCYLSYVTCSCHEHPICLRHGGSLAPLPTISVAFSIPFLGLLTSACFLFVGLQRLRWPAVGAVGLAPSFLGRISLRWKLHPSSLNRTREC